MAKKHNIHAASTSPPPRANTTTSNKRRRLSPEPPATKPNQPPKDTSSQASEIMDQRNPTIEAQAAGMPSSSPAGTGPSPNADNAAKSPAPPRSAHRIHIAASSKISAKVRAALAALGADTAQQSAVQQYGEQLAAADPPLQAPTTNVEADRSKGALVLLEAGAEGGNKLVSVAEIVKRELGKSGTGEWWEYSGVRAAKEDEFRKEAQNNGSGERKGAGGDGDDGGGGKDGDEDEGEESEVAFEEVERKMEGRADPDRDRAVLMVYLSRRQVPALKDMYGEQNSADKR